VNSSDPIRRELFNIQINGVVRCDGVADFFITQDAFMETKAGIQSWIVENHDAVQVIYVSTLRQAAEASTEIIKAPDMRAI
jgi:hypothetical protein